MEQKTTKCSFCRFFEGYYTKGLIHFTRKDCGMCCKHNAIMKNGDTCAEFALRHRPWRMPQRTIERSLQQSLTQRAELRQIIQEHEEEERLWHEQF